MNQKQLEILTRSPKIKISELENISDRTLLFGTFPMADGTVGYHLYIEQEMFHFTAYLVKSKLAYELSCQPGEPLKSFKYRDEITFNQFLRSTKFQTFHPECCDYEFCTLLKSKGIKLDFFDEFDKDRPTKKYYGILFNDLKKVKKDVKEV
jgi:hypothetical protein